MLKTSSVYAYDFFKAVTTNASGEVVIDVNMLNLPPKARAIVIESFNIFGGLEVNGTSVRAGIDIVELADIQASLLKYYSGNKETSTLLDFKYYALDQNDELIHLNDTYYPIDTVVSPTENAIDGGNYNTGASDGGLSPDGGDWDVGSVVTAGYSYDGGDYDTGEALGLQEPPLVASQVFDDFVLDHEDDVFIKVLDSDFDEVNTTALPNINTFAPSNVVPDFNIDLSYRTEYRITYVSKFFEGFDYGSVEPDFGYDVDYGSIPVEGPESFDFSSILNYAEPLPTNGAE